MIQQRFTEICRQLRQYDLGLQQFIVNGAPLVKDSTTVPVIFATPDRAFSTMRELLKDKGIQTNDLKNVPLPFISIERSTILHDPMRQRSPFGARYQDILTSDTSTYTAYFPRPYDIDYNIEVWSRNRETLNAYQYWFLAQFIAHEMFVDVDMRPISEVWGTKIIPFENEGMRDLSNLSPDTENRILRFSLRLKAKAWILADVEEVKKVLQIERDAFLVEDSSVELGLQTADTVDTDPETFKPIQRVVENEDGIISTDLSE